MNSGKETLPVDYDREFRREDYPRDPEEYTALRHFIQRFKEDERFLDGYVIEHAIKHGTLKDDGKGCAAFIWPEDGVTRYIIAGYHLKGYRVLITGWPYLHDRETARETGSWSTEELDTIEQFNDNSTAHWRGNYRKYREWVDSNQQATA